MTINYRVGSAVVFCLGILGDNLGLQMTYLLSTIFAIGSVPAVFFSNKVH